MLVTTRIIVKRENNGSISAFNVMVWAEWPAGRLAGPVCGIAILATFETADRVPLGLKQLAPRG